MRWLAYFILGYVAMGVDVGLSGVLRYQGAGVNFVLLAVVFIAVNAPRDAALLGAFVLGAMQDLTTQEPLGLYALSYGLVAMFIVSTQPAVYRDHPLTHFSMVLVGALVTAVIQVLHGLVHPPGPAHGAAEVVRISPAVLFAGAVYTAIVGPVVLGGLQRIKRVFAFEPGRRKGRTR